jgi:threonine dehydratase
MKSLVHQTQSTPEREPANWIKPTTIIEAPRLARKLGVDLFLASETFQHTGSFKFRAAYQVVSHVPHARFIAASSGNFGQALARACQILGKSCTVVMPESSARVKVEAVREMGGKVDLIDVQRISRSDRVAELAKLDPEAYVASPYDDDFVIKGNATLGTELAQLRTPFEVVLAPVGGGGLTAGLVKGLREAGHRAAVVGAEPMKANDAARSLRAHHLVVNTQEPNTLADGVRTVSLGQRNWEILRDGLADIIEVTEENIAAAVRLLFNLANLKAEPTGALAIAALLTAPEKFAGQRACCVISGGNVDPQSYAEILRGG